MLNENRFLGTFRGHNTRTIKVGRIRESAKTNVFLVITEAIVKYIGEVVKTGKPKFAGKQVIDQHMCLAKDFKKYVRHN
jgi:hypothetical protein